MQTIDDISKIEGIEENTAKELIERAKEYLDKEKNEIYLTKRKSTLPKQLL